MGAAQRCISRSLHLTHLPPSCDRQVSLLTVALMYSISFGIVVVASACYSFLLLVTIVSIEYCSTNVVALGLLDILSLP